MFDSLSFCTTEGDEVLQVDLKNTNRWVLQEEEQAHSGLCEHFKWWDMYKVLYTRSNPEEDCQSAMKLTRKQIQKSASLFMTVLYNTPFHVPRTYHFRYLLYLHSPLYTIVYQTSLCHEYITLPTGGISLFFTHQHHITLLCITSVCQSSLQSIIYRTCISLLFV